jgi:site-specific DNA-methyltransferase (adenine-specific)
MSIKLNKIYNQNCLETMARMPDNFVDLTVTSPPYDNLRKYNGYSFPFEAIAKELFRVTKEGGVVVWVVGDATINGSETGTSFKQALYFKECGFNLHDTMIYKKNSSSFPSSLSGKRYTQIFEFMFVFCKYRIKSHNLIIDKKNKWAGFSSFDGKIDKVKEHSPRENIWEYVTSFNDNTGHPAVFPEQLAADHIRSWSNENDIVYDCFGGSGTTAKMAHVLKRNWILSEISSDYCKLAEKRLAPYLMQKSLF